MRRIECGSTPGVLVRAVVASGIIAAAFSTPTTHAAAAVNDAAAQPDAAPRDALTRSAGVPSEPELVALLRTTLEKVDYGNKTGDYHYLHAELTPQVQKVVDEPRLAAALEGFRKLRVDMDAVARTEPLYERPPEVTPDGLLLLRGTFPTTPREIRFDFGFMRTEGRWRIQALNLDTPGSAALSGAPAGAAAAPQVAAAAPAVRHRVLRKPVDSPFLDPSTDPPTATKW
jgi:hypothetical protein